MKNSFLRTLVPLLSIGLNDEGGADGGAGAGGGGGDNVDPAAGADKGAAAAGGAADKKPDPAAGADASKADAAAKADPAKVAADTAKQAEASKAAAAELGKSYEKWEPKLPEGLPFDKARFGDLRKLFTDTGVKPEVAQKLVDAFAGGELGRLKQVAEGMMKERADWQTQLKADKELAGEDGKQLEKTMAAARRVMQKDATPGFRKLLADSGLEGHPEMIRVLARAGARLKEDDTAGQTRTTGKGPEPTAEQKLKSRYDHPTSASMFEGR